MLALAGAVFFALGNCGPIAIGYTETLQDCYDLQAKLKIDSQCEEFDDE